MKYLPAKGTILKEIILTGVSVGFALWFAPKVEAWAKRRKEASKT